MAIWRAQASSKASDRRLLQSSLLTRNRHNGVNSHCHPSTSAHGVSQTPSGPPYAEMTIWSTVCGYCSSSVRDRRAPSARNVVHNIFNLDFLPIKCDECSKLFCKDHYEYSRHACPFAGRKDCCLPVCPLCSQPVSCPRDFPPDVAVSEHIDRDCQSDPALAKRKIYVNNLFRLSAQNVTKISASSIGTVPITNALNRPLILLPLYHCQNFPGILLFSSLYFRIIDSSLFSNLFGFKTRKRETSDNDLRSMNGMDEREALEEAIRRSIADSVQSSTSNEKSTSDIEQRNQRTNQNSAYGNCLIS
ncbi:AN1-type zinc finger protein 2B [Trichinella nativa]|uniref:AN1-type zinc finger protein 2B n=1 Tax=Trichinella nativa TaxID=6335 RepID=A0A0V1LND5_9BILA|nr:AN1-type zinc finger protein 2B [Trichinella nativa]